MRSLVHHATPALCGFALSAAVASVVAAAQEASSHTVVIDRIRVSKSAHRLDAFAGAARVASYRVAIGRGGAGPKRYEGDGRTPEGAYTIDGRHSSARFHRFLHVSYPNAADRAAFDRASGARLLPAGATIGGNVGIHGDGGGFAHVFGALVDWTRGCMAVDDDAIEMLYARVRPGAAVVISR